MYLQRIADGNNQVNNMPAKEDSVLNNPNVIRCMYFVKEVLEEVKRNDGFIFSSLIDKIILIVPYLIFPGLIRREP